MKKLLVLTVVILISLIACKNTSNEQTDIDAPLVFPEPIFTSEEGSLIIGQDFLRVMSYPLELLFWGTEYDFGMETRYIQYPEIESYRKIGFTDSLVLYEGISIQGKITTKSLFHSRRSITDPYIDVGGGPRTYFFIRLDEPLLVEINDKKRIFLEIQLLSNNIDYFYDNHINDIFTYEFIGDLILSLNDCCAYTAIQIIIDEYRKLY